MKPKDIVIIGGCSPGLLGRGLAQILKSSKQVPIIVADPKQYDTQKETIPAKIPGKCTKNTIKK